MKEDIPQLLVTWWLYRVSDRQPCRGGCGGLDQCPVSALILSFPAQSKRMEEPGPDQRFPLPCNNSVCGPRDIGGNYIHFVQKFRNEPHMKLLEIRDTWICYLKHLIAPFCDAQSVIISPWIPHTWCGCPLAGYSARRVGLSAQRWSWQDPNYTNDCS